MAIRIMTDTAADFAEEELDKYGIIGIPMTVSFGDDLYRDVFDLTKESFYRLLETRKEFPKTSQPSPAAFLEEFEKAKEAGDEVLVITVSAVLSGTYQSACIAQEMAEYDKIRIINSRSVSVGMQILVKYAAERRDQGAQLSQITEEIEKIKKKVVIYAGLDTLENLHRGGRLSRGMAEFGSLAKLKPIVTLSPEGKVEICAKVLGIGRACRRIASLIAKEKINKELSPIFLYSKDAQNCGRLEEAVGKENMLFAGAERINLGSTIGTHIGPGAYGIAFVRE